MVIAQCKYFFKGESNKTPRLRVDSPGLERKAGLLTEVRFTAGLPLGPKTALIDPPSRSRRGTCARLGCPEKLLSVVRKRRSRIRLWALPASDTSSSGLLPKTLLPLLTLLGHASQAGQVSQGRVVLFPGLTSGRCGVALPRGVCYFIPQSTGRTPLRVRPQVRPWAQEVLGPPVGLERREVFGSISLSLSGANYFVYIFWCSLDNCPCSVISKRLFTRFAKIMAMSNISSWWNRKQRIIISHFYKVWNLLWLLV